MLCLLEGSTGMKRVSRVVGSWPDRFFSGLRFITYNFTLPKVTGSGSSVFCFPSDCGCANICKWVVLKPKPILYEKSAFLCCFYFQITVEKDNVSLIYSLFEEELPGNFTVKFQLILSGQYDINVVLIMSSN